MLRMMVNHEWEMPLLLMYAWKDLLGSKCVERQSEKEKHKHRKRKFSLEMGYRRGNKKI
jgi:hypothetical protein